jgi:hypothetical protein
MLQHGFGDSLESWYELGPGGANTYLMYFPGMFPRASTRKLPLRCQHRRGLEEIPMRFSRIRLIVTLRHR